jgi:hypothetical protein
MPHSHIEGIAAVRKDAHQYHAAICCKHNALSALTSYCLETHERPLFALFLQQLYSLERARPAERELNPPLLL